VTADDAAPPEVADLDGLLPLGRPRRTRRSRAGRGGHLGAAGRNHLAALRIAEASAAADPTDGSWAAAVSLGRRDLAAFEEIRAGAVAIHESAVETTRRLSAARPRTLQFQRGPTASLEGPGDLAMAVDDPGRDAPPLPVGGGRRGWRCPGRTGSSGGRPPGLRAKAARPGD
jgi:hypothetical protein